MENANEQVKADWSRHLIDAKAYLSAAYNSANSRNVASAQRYLAAVLIEVSQALEKLLDE